MAVTELGPLEVTMFINLISMFAVLLTFSISVSYDLQQRQATSSVCLTGPATFKLQLSLMYQLASMATFLIGFSIPFALKVYISIARGLEIAQEIGNMLVGYSIPVSATFFFLGLSFLAVSIANVFEFWFGKLSCYDYLKSAFILTIIGSIIAFGLFAVAVIYAFVKKVQAE
ncbi:hypothetical protein PIB30_106661 [Stylosanthes scabra]|uniref:CASP-like protein n=1 Tax=Stylosanthes scabra TaxID=79078 RepID=A0ABU6QZH7_9FABA|nr:hypothetical protein [Stylosanthes scabra]